MINFFEKTKDTNQLYNQTKLDTNLYTFWFNYKDKRIEKELPFNFNTILLNNLNNFYIINFKNLN